MITRMEVDQESRIGRRVEESRDVVYGFAEMVMDIMMMIRRRPPFLLVQTAAGAVAPLSRMNYSHR